MSAVDLHVVDEIVARMGRGRDQAIPILQEVQSRFRYVPVEAIEHLARVTELTESQLYGVATFYSQFRLEPVGRRVVKVCCGTACHVAGSEGIVETLERQLGVELGQTTPDGEYTLTSVACLGCCSLAPVVEVSGERTYGRVSRKRVLKLLGGGEQARGPAPEAVQP
ncbi:MAG: NADH-quinone oxidoreductase subunit NuoE [Deferrisomatales bacterium]